MRIFSFIFVVLFAVIARAEIYAEINDYPDPGQHTGFLALYNTSYNGWRSTEIPWNLEIIQNGNFWLNVYQYSGQTMIGKRSFVATNVDGPYTFLSANGTGAAWGNVVVTTSVPEPAFVLAGLIFALIRKR